MTFFVYVQGLVLLTTHNILRPLALESMDLHSVGAKEHFTIVCVIIGLAHCYVESTLTLNLLEQSRRLIVHWIRSDVQQLWQFMHNVPRPREILNKVIKLPGR